MEKNLKNRPYKLPHKRGEYSRAVEDWFEGFEKELREKIKYDVLEGDDKTPYHILVKEILGEQKLNPHGDVESEIQTKP